MSIQLKSYPQPLETVFLDRDGVINRKMPEGHYVRRWDEFELLPGVAQAIAQLNQAGLRVVVVSNQRGVSLGLYTCADVDAIHARLNQELQNLGAHIDAFFYCPHDKSQCSCRKPLPGLFEQAHERFPEIHPASSAMVGDSFSDIDFGHRLGLRTIFIDSNPERQKSGADRARELADRAVSSLQQAVSLLLEA